jgi:hypothetical protein
MEEREEREWKKMKRGREGKMRKIAKLCYPPTPRSSHTSSASSAYSKLQAIARFLNRITLNRFIMELNATSPIASFHASNCFITPSLIVPPSEKAMG